MLITLPDSSLASLDEATLRFTEIDGRGFVPAKEVGDGHRSPSAYFVNSTKLAQFMTAPTWRFGDCFRRVGNIPRWSPKQCVHDFDVAFLTRLYQFPGSYQGGTFCSSMSAWRFLDGGIVSVNGYGWGSHSWTAVDGMEALRAICLFFGIEQPRRIKGESARRPLARLLEEMTGVPLQPRELAFGGIPWSLEEDDAGLGEVVH